MGWPPNLVPGRRPARVGPRPAPLPPRRARLDTPLLRAAGAAGSARSRRRSLRPARLRPLRSSGRNRVASRSLPRRARGAPHPARARARPSARDLVGRNARARARALWFRRPDERRPQLDARERRGVGGGGVAPAQRAAARRARDARRARARGHLRQPRVRAGGGGLQRAALLPRRNVSAGARADASGARARELSGDVGAERMDAHRRAARLGRSPTTPRARPARARDPGRYDLSTESIAATLVGGLPHAREVVFERSSHTPVLEETERYLDCVRAFLYAVEAR